MKNLELKNVVAFCLLMENSGGIMAKSPDYIEEKFTRYALSKQKDQSYWGLDPLRTQKLESYGKQWGTWDEETI